jgi:hypothetical protein
MGARRVRRAVNRALLVLGGAVAGTAAAWVLSTATAAAEAPELDVVSAVSAQAPRQSLVELLPAPVNTAIAPVVEPVTRTVAEVDQVLRVEQEKARAATTPNIEAVAGRLRGSLGEVGSWIAPRRVEVLNPDAPPLVDETANTAPEASSPIGDSVAPVSVGTPVVEAPATPYSRFGDQRAQQFDPPRTASGDDSRPDFPGDRSPVPFVPFVPPVNVPVHCSCGGDGSGSAGSHNSAAQAAFVNAYNSAVARALKPTTERISVLPGKQPGSTPD